MNNKNRNKGFTLIELLLSVIILALVTAPFLSAFLIADRRNSDSKKMQEASAIGQSVVEDMKSLTFAKLVEKYSPTIENKEINGTDVDTFSIPLSNSQLPGSYNSNYSVDVSLIPRVGDEINQKILPDIKTLDNENSIVFMKDFYNNDIHAVSGGYRKNVFSIEYDTSYGTEKPYIIKHTVEYYDSVNTLVYNTSLSVAYFKKMPTIYMVYTPLSENDKIIIENYLTESQRSTSSELKYLEVYIAQQESYESLQINNKKIKPSNVEIWDANTFGVLNKKTTLMELQNNASTSTSSDELVTNSTKIYTNITSGVVNGNLVTNKQDYSLYDLKVDVKYGAKKITTINTTATIFK